MFTGPKQTKVLTNSHMLLREKEARFQSEGRKKQMSADPKTLKALPDLQQRIDFKGTGSCVISNAEPPV